jgi:amino acid adenylation domain-containing protein/thioester reductase-like protein
MGANARVPFCLEKSTWAIIAMLGILKAGGAFIPLDPTQPHERRQALIQQLDARVLLVSPGVKAACRGLADITVEITPMFLREISTKTLSQKLPKVDPNSVAYILFTSGSTGTPKGVVVEHSPISTSLLAQSRFYSLDSSTRILQFASYTFDMSILEIFSALTSGGSVCTPTNDERNAGPAAFINKFQVNTLFMTPSFIRTIDPDKVPQVRMLLLGGEAPGKDIIRTWQPKVKLINGYGPTEACIASSAFIYNSPDNEPTNIGRGLIQVNWIVDPDDYNKLAPVGSIGELLTQGPVLARGYLNDEEKTKKSFVSCPQWMPLSLCNQNERFYKSGDLVRYNHDGSMEYYGRKDGQVKIRGQRVELGEIEFQIKDSVSDISYAAVDTLLNKAGKVESLVGFFSLESQYAGHDNGPLEASAVQNVIARIASALVTGLPSYMVPKHLIPLGWMPRSEAGKLDRNQLRKIVKEMPPERLATYAPGNGYMPFRACATDTEYQIRDIFAKLLGLTAESISADAGFYDLGGDSIQIVSLAKLISDRYDVAIGISQLNKLKVTVAALALYIQATLQGKQYEGESPEIDIIEKIESMTAKIRNEIASYRTNAFVTPFDSATIFLTGATGYLGTEILRQLVDSEDVQTVVALVRAKTKEQGLERVRETATIAGWWCEDYISKLEIWLGDLSLPQLGLDASQASRLRGQASQGTTIDAIIHNGAVVNWNADYSRLLAANVDSATYLLTTALSSPVHPKFVFVSGGLHFNGAVQRNERAHLTNVLSAVNGYCQTKFVAESVVFDIASELGKTQNRVSVFKPGRIIGRAEKAVANVDDYLWRVAAAAVEIGAYPEEADGWLVVDDMASTAADAIAQVRSAGEIKSFKETGAGLPASTFWSIVGGELGTELAPLPWNDWIRSATCKMNEVGEEHSLWPVQHFLGHLGSVVTPEKVPPQWKRESLEKAVRGNVQYLCRVGMMASKDQATSPVCELRENVIKRSKH